MEIIAVSNFRIEKDRQDLDAVVADFTPAPSVEWLERFRNSLNDRNFMFSEPLTGTTVTVPFTGQSAPAEAAITESVAAANSA